MRRLFYITLVIVCFGCDDPPRGLSGGEAILLGEHPGVHFGAAGDLVGDLNKDGYADIVIGAPDEFENGMDAGSAYVFLGSDAGPVTLFHAKIQGATGDHFGSSVAGLGDINEDGAEDFAVSSQHSTSIGLSSQGSVYIFLGFRRGIKERFAEEADIIVNDDASGTSSVPLTVASAGDLDQDGRLDLAISNSAADKVYIFFNGSLFPTSSRFATSQADLIISGPAGSSFGAAIQSVGNVNDQNVGLKSRFGDDFMVGAPQLDGKGSAFLFVGRQGFPRGSFSVDQLEHQTYSGSVEGDEFGASLAGLGLFDSDLFADLAVGAPGNGFGRVEVFFGQPVVGPSSLDPAIFYGELEGDRYGSAISGMLSAGIGTFPLLAGAPKNNFGGLGAGSVYLSSKLMFASGTSLRGVTAQASLSDQIFRYPFAGVGTEIQMGTFIKAGPDINGDGLADAIFGAPNSAQLGPESGSVVVEW